MMAKIVSCLHAGGIGGCKQAYLLDTLTFASFLSQSSRGMFFLAFANGVCFDDAWNWALAIQG